MKSYSKTISIRALTVLGLLFVLTPVSVFAQTTQALNDSAITPPGQPVTINVLANDTPGSGNLDPATLDTIGPAPQGTLSIDNVNGRFTYTPDTDFNSTEPDTFEYEICDDATQNPADKCDTATVYIYVGTEITTFDIIPKKLNVKKMGVIPVAIRSTEGLDVADIAPESLRLEGVEPHHMHVGKNKITLKFKAQNIVGPIRNDVNDGDGLVLHLTGRLGDPLTGPVIVGQDTVIIIKKGKQN